MKPRILYLESGNINWSGLASIELSLLTRVEKLR